MTRHFLFNTVILFLIPAVCPLWAENSYSAPDLSSFFDIHTVEENYEYRQRLKSLITAPKEEVLKAPSRIFTQGLTAQRVKFRVETRGNSFYLLFLNEKNRVFPIAGRGNYIIKRGLEMGEFKQIKIFYRNDPGSFIRIFPAGERSEMDVFLFGKSVYNKTILPLPLENFLTLSFSRVIALSGSVLKWPLLLMRGDRELDRRIEDIISLLRARLPFLEDTDDGAQDSEGSFVLIKNGVKQEDAVNGGFNCSGFTKWITDGFYYPLTGSYLDIERLKVKHLDFRGNRWSLPYEEERDPYFGLDWSRNLAVNLITAQSGAEEQQSPVDPESADLRRVDFFSYIEDVGYPVADLETLLFAAAFRNPGIVYLGSINSEYGKKPRLRQHFHIVVLLPYFTANGDFRIAVMERNSESSIASLIKRYPADFIHLVRLDARGVFQPPPEGVVE